MHVILAVYVISALALLVICFLVNRPTIIPKRTARGGDHDERPMKTKKEQPKKENKQTSKPQDLVPKKDAKGGWGVGGRLDRRAAVVAVGLNSRSIRCAFSRPPSMTRKRFQSNRESRHAYADQNPE